jgi:hypothetical protein
MPTMKNEDRLPPFVEETAISLSQRQMLRPALLFLISHRPFSFIAGQCLLLALPLGLLFPAWPLRAWADLLSHPQGLKRVERCLHTHINLLEPPTQRNERPRQSDESAF